jgi:1-pyrroline-5-carboxylate dehydrogenase
LISDRLFEYSAAQSYEVGKNRIESLGEIEESADLIRYYAQTMEDNDGYEHPMGNLGDTPSTRSRSCDHTASSPSSAHSTSRWRWPPVRRRPR